jgi:hypothetical protein
MGTGGPRGSPAKKATPKAGVPKIASQPSNQHGTNLDPHKARSSQFFFSKLYDTLIALRKELDEAGKLTKDDWSIPAEKAIYLYFQDLTGTEDYTNQERMDGVRDRALALIRETYDPDLISVVLRDIQDDLPEGIETHGEAQETDARPPAESAQSATSASDSESEQGLGDESQETEGADAGTSSGS